MATWLRIRLPGASCARGTPYAFWTHLSSRRNVLLYFQDGGGCWSYSTCVSHSGFFQDSLRSPDDPGLPERGILAFRNPANPFRGYSMIYIPYCTGDVHWGNHVQTYSDGHGHSLVIHHVGFANDRRVLSWVYKHFRAPARVFVTGCSAGSVGSAAFAPYVIRHYPQATVGQLGDSLAFVFPRPVDIVDGWRADRNLPRWITAVRALNPHRLAMADYYKAMARYYRTHGFAQFNYAEDAVQTRYWVALGGESAAFPAALDASVREIESHAANFHAYFAPGGEHCVLPLDRFNRTRVGGVRLSEWVTKLARGRPVSSVRPN